LRFSSVAVLAAACKPVGAARHPCPDRKMMREAFPGVLAAGPVEQREAAE